MRAREALVTAAILLLVAAMAAPRLGYFPLAVSIVSGYSMYPTIRPGSIAVGVAAWAAGFHRGDIVIYTKGFKAIIHRVVEVRDGVVITKGDNNPYPDPPIEASRVKYRVVLVAPLEYWLTPLIATAVIYSARERSVEAGAAVTLALVLTLYFFTGSLASSIPPLSPRIPRPSVELVEVKLASDYSRLIIKLNAANTRILGIQACTIDLAGPCKASLVNGSTVVVDVPPRLYRELLERGLNRVTARLALELSNGVLRGVYTALFAWKPLQPSILNHSLVIYNPNPAPIRVNVTVEEANITGEPPITTITSSSRSYSLTVEPLGEARLGLPHADEVRVRVSYELLGRSMEWVVRVEG